MRDYGPGLSPERVQNVFVQFGVSTKRATDEMIGGFGIGAKSAWAYTDSFVVRSFHDKMERHYLCHLGTDPEGSMALLFEGPTDQPNGVEIQVQVKERDVERAQTLIAYLLLFWDQKPNILNYQYSFHQLVDVPGFGVKATVSPYITGASLYVSLDGVPYIIQDSYIQEKLGSLRHSDFSQHTFVFMAKTGDLDVAANRENIEINDKYYAWCDGIRRQIVRSIFKLHFETAKKGLVAYIRFWNRMGKRTCLMKQTKTQSDERKKEISNFENDTLFGFAEHLLREHPNLKLPEYMYPRLGFPLDITQPLDSLKSTWIAAPLPSEHNRGPLCHFVWYFEKEKVLFLDGFLFPFELMDKKFIFRARNNVWSGRSWRRGKEYFHNYVKVWEPMYSVFSAEWFAPVLGYGPVERISVIYNDLKDDPVKARTVADKLKSLNSRIPTHYKSILDVDQIPSWMEELNVLSVTKALKPVTRYDSPKVKRETGSIRRIDAYDFGFSFGNYEEASALDIKKKKDVIYILNKEKTNTWKPLMEPVFARIAINDQEVVQVSQAALEYLKSEKCNLIYWKDWFETNKVQEKKLIKLTSKELEVFGACWMYDKHHTGFELMTHYGFHNFGIEHAGYLKLAAKLKELKGLINKETVRTFVFENRKRTNSISKSRIFKDRCDLIRAYPMLPLVESMFERQHLRTDILSSYLKEPKKFTQKMIRQYTSTADWLARDEDDIEG